MIFEDVKLILEKRQYKHREDYTGNKKGSYIDKGKTKWDYSSGDAKPGNERIVTQIQNKIRKFGGGTVSREKIKKVLKQSDDLFESFRDRANRRFGENEESKAWRSFVFGGFTSVIARKLMK